MEPPVPRFDPSRRRAVVFALLLVTALASFESTVVSTAMPTIVSDLGGLPLYSWVFSVYLLASTVSMPLFGRLADLHGRRRVLLAAIVLFVAGAVSCAFARSMPQLVAARGLQGLGAGGLVPVALTVTGDLFSLEERARVQGLFSGVWGVASLVGPLLGAGLTVTLGWRSIFSINVPLGVVAFVLVKGRLLESRAPRGDALDVAGAVTLAGAVTALLLVAAPGPAGALGGAGRLALLLGGAACLAAFVVVETRRKDPLVPLELFRRRATAGPYAAGVLLGTTIYGVDTFVPLFVQGALGGTAASAGAVVTPLVLGWSLSATLGAKAVVRFGFRRTARAGALVILGGFAILLSATAAASGVAAISAACGVIGLGLGPSSIAQVLAVQATVAEERRGVATSLVPFCRTVGGSLGVGALGGLLATGLAARLGAAASDAGRLVSGGPGGLLQEAVRHALEVSLLPVFGVLAALAVVNAALTALFPDA